MNKIFLISILAAFIQLNTSAKTFDNNKFFQTAYSDTIKEVPAEEEAAIEEVLKSRALPQKDKVQYFSQVTKYGFKNLFKNYSYNASMPYSSQVNPYAESYMQDYLHAHGKYLKGMRNTAAPYFNLIDNILAQYGLPKELKYLAVIESNLNSQAMSWVGARGPWQFMSYTAKDYGLQVNGFVDDRTDYYKSTHAAARYLLALYKDLKDWLLVIAAYNGGPGRVYSAIKKSGSRNFWALQYYLPTESRNHVKKFIATHYIMETSDNADTPANFDYTSLNTTSGVLSKPNLTETEADNTSVLNISGRYNSVIIAKNLMLDINQFNRFNPGFDMSMSSGDAYDLRLPSDKMDLFVANKYPILNECIQVLLNDTNADTKTVYQKNRLTFKKKS